MTASGMLPSIREHDSHQKAIGLFDLVHIGGFSGAGELRVSG